MALVLNDRVKETSTTTGTGTYSLAGAVTGFQGFVAGIGDGNTCYYCATDGTNWEVGLGTVTDATPDTLARTTVLESSNSDAAVDWGAGTKTIFCTMPAEKVPLTAAIVFSFDGGGSEIADSAQFEQRIPFACQITKATLLADQSGSIVIDVWKDTLANYPPTDADSITASAPPTISTNTDSEDSTLTGWTKTITAGDVLKANVDSATTITRAVLILDVVKT